MLAILSPYIIGIALILWTASYLFG